MYILTYIPAVCHAARQTSITKTASTVNKYSHAAVWGLVPNYIKEDGSPQYPVAAMVANLAKPTPERPALMRRVDSVGSS